MSDKRHMLPGTIRPQSYELTIDPDFEKASFSGEENIEIQVARKTGRIKLHAAGLEIRDVRVFQGRKPPQGARIRTHKSDGMITLLLNDYPLQKGRATVSLAFRGVLGEEMSGFYTCNYQSPDGGQKTMAVTQFEATSARRAFPCWDEPGAKATFRLSLIVPAGMRALSNMPYDYITKYGDASKKKWVFQPTPVMSTYLLAFAVGEFEGVSGKTKNGTVCNVYATPGKSDQCAFALDIGIRVLEYLEDYYGIPYPLPKMDMLAVPNFAAGAMENWGLITYRETALLLDPKNSSLGAKQLIAEVVAHELAHQWFGNLVTMQWWNALWLNESFATWMANKVLDAFFPQWDMRTSFYAGANAQGMALDGLKNTHPIEVEVCSAQEVDQIFDAISYAKGGAVLRMLEDWLGEETFQKGLSIYLNKHAYDNATTEDLWAALEEAGEAPVTDVMDTWVKQGGYPVVFVQEKYIKSRKRWELELHQRHFSYDGKGNNRLWKIPITVEAGGSELTRVLMDTRTVSVPLGHTWQLAEVNAGRAGFFRVQYKSPLHLKNLGYAVAAGDLSTVDRLGLVSDFWALVQAQMVPIADYLKFLQWYKDETEYTVWGVIAGSLDKISSLLDSEPYAENLRAFMRDLLAPVVGAVGWDVDSDEPETMTLTRALVLGYAGMWGDEGVIAESKRRFLPIAESHDPSLLNPDLRALVYGTVAAHDDEKTGYGFEALLDLYRTVSLDEEKVRCLRAMAQTRLPARIREVLAFSLTKEVSTQNTIYGLVLPAQHSIGRDIAWEFLTEHLNQVLAIYGDGKFLLGHLFGGIIAGFSTKEDKDRIAALLADHPVPSAERAIAQALEKVDLNIALKERNAAEVGEWLARGAHER